jgi:ABC-type branched-subunit amino acid transport system permease subunit
MAVITRIGAPHTVNFSLLPWSGAWALAAAAVIGALILLLAVRGKAQSIYRLWSLIVLVLVVRYFFFTDYSYTPGTNGVFIALSIILCAVIAFFGSGIRVAKAR